MTNPGLDSRRLLGKKRFSSVGSLMRKYPVLLFDAYGVLVDKTGALAGAPELIAHLNASAKPYYELTNSASRLPATMSAGFKAFGLDIPAGRISYTDIGVGI